MQNNELKNLKSRLEAIRKANESIYLKLNDCIYKTVGPSGLEEVQEIPPGAKVENIDCNKERFFYYYSDCNNEPHYGIVKSVTQCILEGDLEDDRDWLNRNTNR